MADLTEKNLENVLLNLTKTDKPITVRPTTWFKPHQCPRCFGLFKVGDRFWNDSGTVYHWVCWVNKSKEKNT